MRVIQAGEARVTYKEAIDGLEQGLAVLVKGGASKLKQTGLDNGCDDAMTPAFWGRDYADRGGFGVDVQ